MAVDAQQEHLTVMESSGVTLMARIRYPDGAYATIATTTSITRHTWSDGVEIESGTALVVADTIFDTLQTTALDARWTKDTTGANCIDEVDDNVFVDGDKVYDVFYIIEPASMARVVIPPFRLHVRNMPGE